MRIILVLTATGVGAAAGWLCGQVPVWPGARLAAASVVGLFVGGIGTVLLVLLRLNRSGSGGLGAVSFGLSDAGILGVPAAVLLTVVGYVGLRQFGWSSAGLATHGPTIAGGGAALMATLWVGRGLTISAGGVP